MTKSRAVLAGAVIVGLALSTGAAVLTCRSEITPVSPRSADSFDKALVKNGEALARVGNCTGCHTVPGGRPFAGGRALETPFGTIYATNITPASETGIGTWSAEAFVRAMREGIARDGHHLYPAFPYDHFTKARSDELDALYAFLMTRAPVEAGAPDNRVVWPLDHRFLVAGWNLLFLREGPSALPDRGQELAEGLAHCGGCHTPRNRLGAEDKDRAYDGAWSEGWYAPPLNAHSPAAKPWTESELFAYLRTGLSKTHAAAAGPMGGVVRQLSVAPEADVRAIARHFAGLMKDVRAVPDIDNRQSADKAHPDGAALFAGACAACHEPGAPMMQQGRPPLAWGTALREDAPHDTLHLIVDGLRAPAAEGGPEMPGFGGDFTDSQIADIAAYIRARFTELPPWPALGQAISDVRKGAKQ